MRILQLNFEPSWRGGERQVLFCMRAFRQAGHEVELLCRAGSALQARVAAEGFTAHGRRSPPGMLAFLATRGGRYDIMHAQTANTVTWAVLTRALHRRPVVFTRRTPFPVRSRSEWKTAMKWRRVDALAAISQAAAAEPRRLGLHPVVIHSAVEPHIVDTARAAELAREYGLQGRKVLGTAAAMSREKDPVTLVRAVAELARTRNDFVFLHFGAGGDREAAARAEVAAQGLEGIYRFMGFRERVEDYYSLLDVFVLTSRQEGLGSSVLDAFLHGVPVVSTDAGGLKELLADGRGLLCAVGDAPALARGMARCLDDADFRADAVRRAYDYAVSEHGVMEMGRRYLDLYQRILDARHG